MKKQIVSMLLAVVMLLGMIPTVAFAADSEQKALGEIDIYNGGDRLSYLSINGRVRELIYIKYDSVTGEALSGARFQVKYLSGSSGTGGTVIGTYVTSTNGSITVTGLKAGTYIVEEVSSPNGHVIDTEPQTAQIKAGQTVTLEFRNHPKGGLIINKLDSVTHKPLEGVEFEIKYADGSYVDAAGGTLSSKGKYWTDKNGQIILSEITGTVVVTETKTIPGYTVHAESRSQTVVVNPSDTQTLYFYNDPVGGVEIIKVNEDDQKERIPNTTFEIRKLDDELIDTVTTDKNGRQVLASNLLTSNNYTSALNAIPMQAGEVVTDIYFDFGKGPVGFQSKTDPTLSVMVSGKAVNGYQMVNRADAGGLHGGTCRQPIPTGSRSSSVSGISPVFLRLAIKQQPGCPYL